MFHFPFRRLDLSMNILSYSIVVAPSYCMYPSVCPLLALIPEAKCTVVANASFILTDVTTRDRLHVVKLWGYK